MALKAQWLWEVVVMEGDEEEGRRSSNSVDIDIGGPAVALPAT